MGPISRSSALTFRDRSAAFCRLVFLAAGVGCGFLAGVAFLAVRLFVVRVLAGVALLVALRLPVCDRGDLVDLRLVAFRFAVALDGSAVFLSGLFLASRFARFFATPRRYRFNRLRLSTNGN